MRIHICDKDKDSLSFYKNLCMELDVKCKDAMDVTTCESGEALLFSLSDPKQEIMDIILIDVCSIGEKGISIVRELREKGYDNEIIFLTDSKELFREAFDVLAFNYVVKKVDSKERFQDVLSRAIRRVEEEEDESIALNRRGEQVFIPIKDIYYFEIINRIVTIHYKDDSFEFISTMNKLEENLKDFGFVRIHRAMIVSGIQIQSYTSKQVVLKDGSELPVGRAYAKEIKEWMLAHR